MKTKKKIHAAPVQMLTHQQVADLVMTLSPDRLISVYDFARFVQSLPLTPAPAAEIFSETDDEAA